jgi:hypothetical protein
MKKDFITMTTKHFSRLSMPFGNGTPLPVISRVPHIGVTCNANYTKMPSDKRFSEGVRLGLDQGKHFAVPWLPTREDSNPHSIAVHRPPSYDPRGFLP